MNLPAFGSIAANSAFATAATIKSTASQTIMGMELRGGISLDLGRPVTTLDAVVDLDMRAFYF
jgi:hypothetical protein